MVWLLDRAFQYWGLVELGVALVDGRRQVQVVRLALQPEVRCVRGAQVVVLQVQAQRWVVLRALTRQQALLVARLVAGQPGVVPLFELVQQQVVRAVHCYHAVLACDAAQQAARVVRLVAGRPGVVVLLFELVQRVVRAVHCYRAVLACHAAQQAARVARLVVGRPGVVALLFELVRRVVRAVHCCHAVLACRVHQPPVWHRT
ncbi:MAG: hypothetical protein ABIO88_05255, partial [Burkholderiaceae bacterium]